MKDNEKKKDRKSLYLVIAIVCMALFGITILSLNKGDSNPTTGDVVNTFVITPEYYSNLPSKPENFDVVKALRQQGVIEDVPERIDETYWKQVDWFPLPETFLDAVENTANTQYHPWWCVGFYDAQITGRIENIDRGTTFTQRVWMRTMPGSRLDFGVKLVPSYPSKKEMIGSRKYGTEDRTIFQDIEVAREHIKAKILRICSDSNNCENTDTTVLGWTLPKLEYDYVKEVWFEVEVSKDIPKGTYIVNFDAVAPDKKFTSDRVWDAIESNQGYNDPNIGNSCGVPHFTFFVEVR